MCPTAKKSNLILKNSDKFQTKIPVMMTYI